MTKWYVILRLAIFAVVLPLLVTCRDNLNEPEPTPTFTISVSGDINRDLAGVGATFFFLPRTEAGPIWHLDLQSGSASTHEAVEFIRRDAQPEIGTYTLSDAQLPDLVPPGQTGVIVLLQGSGSQPGFVGSATSGSITITASTPREVRGEFTFEANGNLFPVNGFAEPGTLTIDGDFAAVPVEACEGC